MMGLPGRPLDRMERSLGEVLSQTRAVRVAGRGLELLAEGRQHARRSSRPVYLR